MWILDLLDDALAVGWRVWRGTLVRQSFDATEQMRIVDNAGPLGASIGRRGLLALMFSSVAIAGFGVWRAEGKAAPGESWATADSTIITIDQI
jgi:hypothetical protein